jgi:hypothetical protein
MSTDERTALWVRWLGIDIGSGGSGTVHLSEMSVSEWQKSSEESIIFSPRPTNTAKVRVEYQQCVYACSRKLENVVFLTTPIIYACWFNSHLTSGDLCPPGGSESDLVAYALRGATTDLHWRGWLYEQSPMPASSSSSSSSNDVDAASAAAAGFHWRHPTSGRRTAQHPRTAVLRAKIEECRVYRRLGRAAECVCFSLSLSLSLSSSSSCVLVLVLVCYVPLDLSVFGSVSLSLSLSLSLLRGTVLRCFF